MRISNVYTVGMKGEPMGLIDADAPILREVNPEVKSMRIMLCDTVATAIKNTMDILGIEVPERM